MPLTREQERDRKRAQRAKKRLQALNGGLPVPPVAEMNDPERPERDLDLWSVEAKVQKELDSLPQSKVMTSAAGIALAMARVLDTPGAVPQHPSSAAQLRLIMADIRAAKAASGPSKLTMIRGGRTAS